MSCSNCDSLKAHLETTSAALRLCRRERTDAEVEQESLKAQLSSAHDALEAARAEVERLKTSGVINWDRVGLAHENTALRAIVGELCAWIDTNGEHVLLEDGRICGASPCYCGVNELIARARGLCGGTP